MQNDGVREIYENRTPEFAAVPGLEAIGPLPAELQSYFVFSDDLSSNAKHKAALQDMEPG